MDKELEDALRADPYSVTCWGAPTVEEAEESKRLLREGNPLWFFEDTYYETELLVREAAEWAKRELLRKMALAAQRKLDAA